MCVNRSNQKTYLLLPTLKLFNQEVVPLGDFAKLGIHPTFEVDEILPSLQCIPGVLVSLAHNLIQVAHGNLSHERFLHSATEDGFHAGVSSLF